MTGDGQVDVKLYYECLCPDCMKFDKEQFSVAVEKLSQYVDFKTYPYGNARVSQIFGSSVRVFIIYLELKKNI